MLSALLATALAVASVDPSNALPLQLRGRTVTLTAAQLASGCGSCSLMRAVSQTPPPPPPTTDDQYTAPPLLDSEDAVPPAGELTPPPDVPSWQTPEQPPPPKKKEPKNGVTYDPNLGSWVPREVAMGALALVLTDVLAGTTAGVALLVGFAGALGGNSSSLGVAGIVIGFGILILHTLLSPLWAAIAVKTTADEPTANGLGGAVLGAYIGALALGGVGIGVLFALTLLESAFTAGSSAYAAVSSLGTLVLLAGVVARWVGIPLAASWALHRGTPPAKTAAFVPHPRRPVIVTADGREAKPIGGATVLAF